MLALIVSPSQVGWFAARAVAPRVCGECCQIVPFYEYPPSEEPDAARRGPFAVPHRRASGHECSGSACRAEPEAQA